MVSPMPKYRYKSVLDITVDAYCQEQRYRHRSHSDKDDANEDIIVELHSVVALDRSACLACLHLGNCCTDYEFVGVD